VKVGDLVRWKNGRILEIESNIGVIVSELRHGINSSFVDVLVDGKIIPVNFRALEVICESR
jgi:DNA-binding Xre family transcriptional regulator